MHLSTTRPSPNLPADLETKRLAALYAYRILDTSPEQAFDDLVQLAAHVCAVPLAAVSLVDRARQWFKASVGIDVPQMEIPAEVAFCNWAICQREPLVVPDARLDPRFAINPLVAAPPHLRFYAAAPLVTPDGYALGTLCVLDVEPKKLTDSQMVSLEALARQVVSQLELRRHLWELAQLTGHLDRARHDLAVARDELEERVLRRTEALRTVNTRLRREVAERRRAERRLTDREQQLKIALDTARLGSWQLDLTSFALSSSEQCKVNFGLSPQAPFTYEHLQAAVHPEDRARVRQAVARALDGQVDYDAQYRVVWPDGSIHWIMARGRVHYSAQGEPLRMVGVCLDATGRHLDEQKRRAMLDAQEGERRRLARELHDEIGQALTAVKLGLQAVLLGVGPMQIHDCLQTTEQALAQVRDLSLTLRPSLLDDLGLGAALRWYVDRQMRHSPLVCELEITTWPGRLPQAVETGCFRIVQEALGNVLRHADARRVQIAVALADKHLCLRVADDGRGFEVAAARHRAISGGSLGLLAMEERTALLGGRIAITSEPGRGTEISVVLPITGDGG